jgi:zinc/manganese transport system substrate-binding protein
LLISVSAALALTGCGEGVTPGGGPPQVVAAEDMWGSIASQLAGPSDHVQSIVASAAEDPHAYEPTAADARAMATAGVAIVNGIGYDPWADKLLAAAPSPGRVVINVGDLLHVRAGANPHRWYDPDDVVTVARAISAALQRLDPGHRAAYARRLATFLGRGLAAYDRTIATIRRRYAGVPVGASESVFAVQAPALGLRLLTPAGFMRAVSEGTDISAGDTATATRQITTRSVRVWILNSQNSTPAVGRMTSLARARGIPVAAVTETLTPPQASFQGWQLAQLTSLARALHQATGR